MSATIVNNRFALIIFIKNPDFGKVKTRLAQEIGDKKALEVYLELLTTTLRATTDSGCDKYMFYSDRIETPDVLKEWLATGYQERKQFGKDLGERMLNAFAELFAMAYERVVIIGSDCFEISAELINESFFHLAENDAVIGPAVDGGYYLLGLKSPHAYVFRDKKWSSSDVLPQTLLDFAEHGAKVHLLTPLRDVDTKADLAYWQDGGRFLS